MPARTALSSWALDMLVIVPSLLLCADYAAARERIHRVGSNRSMRIFTCSLLASSLQSPQRKTPRRCASRIEDRRSHFTPKGGLPWQMATASFLARTTTHNLRPISTSDLATRQEVTVCTSRHSTALRWGAAAP